MISLIGVMATMVFLKVSAYGQDPDIYSSELIKKLEKAKHIISGLMVNQSSEIPFSSVGIDQKNHVLLVGINRSKALYSEEEYQDRIKEIVGEIPVKVEFDTTHALVPTCDRLFGIAEGLPVDLKYDIEGGSVVQICQSTKSPSVGVEVDSKNDGKITITIPRKMVYSLDNLECVEGKPFILLDGEETIPIDVKRNKDENMFTVGLSKGTHKIEFIGYEIIPYPSPSMLCGIARGFDSQFLPPKLQFENGVPLHGIRCNSGLDLVLNSNNGKPICIKSNSVVLFLSRGWAKDLSCVKENLVTLGNETFSCFCSEGEEYVKGGYHVPKNSSLRITLKENISNENKQKGISIDIINPETHSQFVSVWSTCK